MDFLSENKMFTPPDIRSLEHVIEYGLQLNKGRVFSDVWDIDLFAGCSKCKAKRKERLIQMNHDQNISQTVTCTC